MKNKNLIIGSLVAMVIIGVALYFFIKKANKSITTGTDPIVNPNSGSTNTPTTTPTNNNTTTAGQGATSRLPVLPSWLSGWFGGSGTAAGSLAASMIYNSSAFPLKFGSEGQEVKNLQSYLNSHVSIPFSLLEVDGDFGSYTQAALLRTTGQMEVTEDWYRTNILKLS